MRTSLRSLVLLALAALVFTLLAPLGATPARASEEPAPNPMLGAPKVGQCYDVAGRIPWTSEYMPAKPRSCRKAHTLWVYSVTALPADVPNEYGNDAFHAAIRPDCMRGVERMIGGSTLEKDMSSYDYFVIGPTKAQRRAGAHWAACVAGIRGDGSRYSLDRNRLPRPVSLDRMRVPDLFDLCSNRRNKLVNCSEDHAYRASFGKVIKRKPTERNIDRAVRQCPRSVLENGVWWTRHRSTDFTMICFERV